MFSCLEYLLFCIFAQQCKKKNTAYNKIKNLIQFHSPVASGSSSILESLNAVIVIIFNNLQKRRKIQLLSSVLSATTVLFFWLLLCLSGGIKWAQPSCKMNKGYHCFNGGWSVLVIMWVCAHVCWFVRCYFAKLYFAHLILLIRGFHINGFKQQCIKNFCQNKHTPTTASVLNWTDFVSYCCCLIMRPNKC